MYVCYKSFTVYGFWREKEGFACNTVFGKGIASGDYDYFGGILLEKRIHLYRSKRDSGMFGDCGGGTIAFVEKEYSFEYRCGYLVLHAHGLKLRIKAMFLRDKML